jgi:hypothetical protein
LHIARAVQELPWIIGVQHASRARPMRNYPLYRRAVIRARGPRVHGSHRMPPLPHKASVDCEMPGDEPERFEKGRSRISVPADDCPTVNCAPEFNRYGMREQASYSTNCSSRVSSTMVLEAAVRGPGCGWTHSGRFTYDAHFAAPSGLVLYCARSAAGDTTSRLRQRLRFLPGES